MKASPSRRSRVLELAALSAIAVIVVAWAAVAGPATARVVRRAFTVLDPTLVLELAAGIVVVGVAWSFFSAGRQGDVPPSERREHAAVHRIPTTVAVGSIVAAAALFRIVLGAANHYPKVLGDELVYTGIAKGWAFDGEPLLRGARDVGHSTLYPLLIAPLFRLSDDGAAALGAIRVTGAVLMALTAVPAYLLARRVVSRRWAIGVSALSALAPWTAYAALTMTESLFYPAFVGFAAILVWTLDRPTVARQAAALGSVAILIGIRAQAIAIVAGMVAAIVLQGGLDRAMTATIRRFLPTFGVLAAGAVFGVGAALAGISIPTSSYNSVFDSFDRLGGMIEWSVWNLAALTLTLGVVALAALPVALAGMLRRSAEPAVRHTGVVAVTLGLALLGSVALLSAGPYGLGTLHERNLFYVAPLILTCLCHWLANGLERPRRLAVVSAVAAVAVIALLPERVVDASNDVDAPSSAFLTALADDLPGLPLRGWTILIAVVGVATFLLVRRPLFVLVSVVLAFAAVTARVDYRDSLTGAEARALAWVDPALPGGATATLVYLGVPYGSDACAAAAAAEQQDLTTWTEAFNNRVRLVRNVYQPNPRDGLASPALEVGDGGTILSDGEPYSPEFVVVDSRQPLVGKKLARFDLASIGSTLQNGASLTLWRVEPPLRFYPRADPLPPRGDGRGC